MSLLSAYKNGLTNIWQHKKMLFFVYVFNLVFTYLMTMRVSMILSEALDNTTMANNLLEKFDFAALASIINQYGKGVKILPLMSVYIVFYVIFNTFLAGGILKIFSKKENYQIKNFVSMCAEYFGRFFRLLLYSLIFIFIAIIVFLVLSGIFNIFTGDGTSEVQSFIFFLVRIAMLLLLLIIINMLFDYAKIMTVTNDPQNMFRIVRQSLVFVYSNFFRVFFLYFLFFLTAIILLCIYWIVEGSLSITSGFTIFLFFILTQIFILFKVWIRLSFFNGQTEYYQHLVQSI